MGLLCPYRVIDMGVGVNNLLTRLEKDVREMCRVQRVNIIANPKDWSYMKSELTKNVVIMDREIPPGFATMRLFGVPVILSEYAKGINVVPEIDTSVLSTSAQDRLDDLIREKLCGARKDTYVCVWCGQTNRMEEHLECRKCGGHR